MKVMSIAFAVVTSEEVMHGLGKHIDELSAEDATIALKVSFTQFQITCPHNGNFLFSRCYRVLASTACVLQAGNVRTLKIGTLIGSC